MACDPFFRICLGALVVGSLSVQSVDGRQQNIFHASFALNCTAPRCNDPETAGSIASLNGKIAKGKIRLRFQENLGYLQSVLKALNISIESQLLVFSKTSGQASLISPQKPRALFFNDSTVIGWVPGGFIEAADAEPAKGIGFYTLAQSLAEKPVFEHRSSCLGCHVRSTNSYSPDLLVHSVFTAPDGRPDPRWNQRFSDDTSSFQERWGGWYVTGKRTPLPHLGNTVVMNSGKLQNLIGNNPEPRSLTGKIELHDYPAPYSDVVALLIFDHQMHLVNLLNQVSFQTKHSLNQQSRRASAAQKMVVDAPMQMTSGLHNVVKQAVDSMLLIGEAPFASKIVGSSGFTEKFSRLGPYDRKGRSLHQLNLKYRLLKYSCSYMIYSRVFDEMPDQAKQMIYELMWQVLSRQVTDKQYEKLSLSDRQAVIEILQDTKPDLPKYFQSITQ